MRFVRLRLVVLAADAQGKGRIGGNAQDVGNAQGAEGAQAAAGGTTETNESTEANESAEAGETAESSEAAETSEASEASDASETNEAAEAEAQPVTFALEDKVTVQTQDRRTVTGTVVGAPNDVNGNQVTVEWDEPLDGKKVTAMSADDLAQMVVKPQGQAEG